jgi:transcriptional regulator
MNRGGAPSTTNVAVRPTRASCCAVGAYIRDMYRPRHFAADDSWAIATASRIGFGHLVVSGAAGLESTPLPFLVSPDGMSIRAHVARPNPIWRAAPCSMLLIVSGADAYVSPSVYPSKQVDGKVVPTWNYEVVHAHGSATVIDDADWLLNLVTDLTDRHEGARVGRSETWAVSDAPDEYLEKLLGAIVGLELNIERWEGKRKLSQNRGEDIAAVAADLATGSPTEQQVAAAMLLR